jgi:sugar phosphate isomerase/epimerase
MTISVSCAACARRLAAADALACNGGMGLRYAWNTNGCANHRLEDALALIAEAGYDGVALTVDWHHFDPFAPDFDRRAAALARRLKDLGLGLVVETGARYLLDPRRKHEPTLISPEPEGRRRRVDFLKRCIDLCAACGGETTSFWAGAPRPGLNAAEAWRWLQEGVYEITEYAGSVGGEVSLEPEPGMLIQTPGDWMRLAKTPGYSGALLLALDVGHCLVTGDCDPAEAVRECAGVLGTVSIEDMRAGRHEHLPFGQGDLDVAGVLRALLEIGYQRLVCVELSRESHRAHEAIPEAIAFLRTTEAAL